MRHLIFLLLVLVFLPAACIGELQPEEAFPPEEMVVVPAGWFWRGEEGGRRVDRPRHKVYLDAFAIDRTEVTNTAFAKFVAAANYQTEGWDDRLAQTAPHKPVVGVLWRDADAYCRWADKRLPTEAEWEKAARGTDGRRYPWGDTWDATRCNTAESGRAGPLPVGGFPEGASPYGALDMAGNAAEWVADYFDFSDYANAPDHNPTGPTRVSDHGLRGGSWASPAEQAQTFFRDSSHSARPNFRVGFRCALSPP
jgi:formylglycine-generating enzyme required for sulfatase activity